MFLEVKIWIDNNFSTDNLIKNFYNYYHFLNQPTDFTNFQILKTFKKRKNYEKIINFGNSHPCDDRSRQYGEQ